MRTLSLVTRSLWEPQGICGLKGVLTLLIMSVDMGITPVKATLSQTGFLLALATYCQYDKFLTTQWLVLVLSLKRVCFRMLFLCSFTIKE